MAGKVLYLSWTIPPETTGSAIIAMNLAKRFTREEMLLAGERPYCKPPVAWNRHWPELHYVQSVWPVTGRGLRWWRLLQLPRTLWSCVRLVRREGIDRILAVFPDWKFLLAGYLAARITGVSFYAYFHNTYYENRKGLAKWFAAWLQNRVFRQAKHVFVMSEGMSRLYRQRYPELKATPLVHAFNEPVPEYADPPKVGSPMRAIFCGNLNESCMDAAARLGKALAQCPDVVLSVFSGADAEHFRRGGMFPPASTCESISRDEVPRRLADADLLLLPHGFTSAQYSRDELLTIFPTKTIEYLISGRPILAHCPLDCYLAQFLAENDCAMVVDRPDVDALVTAIRQLRTDQDLRCRLVRNALRAARRFQAPAVAAELRMWLNMNTLKEVGPDLV